MIIIKLPAILLKVVTGMGRIVSMMVKMKALLNV
jgi:hypothetical protein